MGLRFKLFASWGQCVLVRGQYTSTKQQTCLKIKKLLRSTASTLAMSKRSSLPLMCTTPRETARSMFYIGDLLRACNINPTLNTIDELGGEKEKGKRMMKIDDFYPIFAKAKASKDTGGIHDFVEILKLYDKNDDGTILGNELFRLLTNLGEKLTKEEAKGLVKELCEPEDDEGFMPFMPFLERMCSSEG